MRTETAESASPSPEQIEPALTSIQLAHWTIDRCLSDEAFAVDHFTPGADQHDQRVDLSRLLIDRLAREPLAT